MTSNAVSRYSTPEYSIPLYSPLRPIASPRRVTPLRANPPIKKLASCFKKSTFRTPAASVGWMERMQGRFRSIQRLLIDSPELKRRFGGDTEELNTALAPVFTLVHILIPTIPIPNKVIQLLLENLCRELEEEFSWSGQISVDQLIVDASRHYYKVMAEEFIKLPPVVLLSEESFDPLLERILEPLLQQDVYDPVKNFLRTKVFELYSTVTAESATTPSFFQKVETHADFIFQALNAAFLKTIKKENLEFIPLTSALTASLQTVSSEGFHQLAATVLAFSLGKLATSHEEIEQKIETIFRGAVLPPAGYRPVVEALAAPIFSSEMALALQNRISTKHLSRMREFHAAFDTNRKKQAMAELEGYFGKELAGNYQTLIHSLAFKGVEAIAKTAPALMANTTVRILLEKQIESLMLEALATLLKEVPGHTLEKGIEKCVALLEKRKDTPSLDIPKAFFSLLFQDFSKAIFLPMPYAAAVSEKVQAKAHLEFERLLLAFQLPGETLAELKDRVCHLSAHSPSLAEGLSHLLLQGLPQFLPPEGNGVKGNVLQSVKHLLQEDKKALVAKEEMRLFTERVLLKVAAASFTKIAAVDQRRDLMESLLEPALKQINQYNPNAELSDVAIEDLSFRLIAFATAKEQDLFVGPPLVQQLLLTELEEILPKLIKKVVLYLNTKEGMYGFLKPLLKNRERNPTAKASGPLLSGSLQQEVDVLLQHTLFSAAPIASRFIKPETLAAVLRDSVHGEYALSHIDSAIQQLLPVLHPQGVWISEGEETAYEQTHVLPKNKGSATGDQFFPLGQKKREWDFSSLLNRKSADDQDKDAVIEQILLASYTEFKASFRKAFERKLEGGWLLAFWDQCLGPALLALTFPLRAVIGLLIHRLLRWKMEKELQKVENLKLGNLIFALLNGSLSEIEGKLIL